MPKKELASRYQQQLHRQSSQLEPSPIVAKKKSIWQRLIWRKVAVFFVAIYVVIHFVLGCFEIIDLKQQEKVVAQQLTQANQERQRLLAEIEYISTDEAIETLARENLGFIKPGEILIRRATPAEYSQ